MAKKSKKAEEKAEEKSALQQQFDAMDAVSAPVTYTAKEASDVEIAFWLLGIVAASVIFLVGLAVSINFIGMHVVKPIVELDDRIERLEFEQCIREASYSRYLNSVDCYER